MILLVLLLQAASPECRQSTVVTQDGRQSVIRYCKGADGTWVRTGGTALPPPPLPQSTPIAFAGTFDATLTEPGPPLRRLDIKSLLASAGKSTPLSGTVTMTLTFEGEAVRGQASGTGGLRSVGVSGLVRAGKCRLITDDQSMVYEGACGRDGFTGKMSSTGTSRNTVRGSFTMRLNSVGGLPR